MTSDVPREAQLLALIAPLPASHTPPAGIHFSLACTIADIVTDILAPVSMVDVGWTVYFANTEAGPTDPAPGALAPPGPQIYVPGIGPFPMRREGRCFYLDIVPAVSLGGPPGSVTFHNPAMPAHRSLPVTPLLVDTGAGQTILRPALL